MVQKIHSRDVILVPSSRLMWADHQKNLKAVPSIHEEVHGLLEEIIGKNNNTHTVQAESSKFASGIPNMGISERLLSVFCIDPIVPSFVVRICF